MLDARCSIPASRLKIEHLASSIEHPDMKTKQRKLKRERNSPYKPLPKGTRGGVELLLIHSVEHVGKQGQVVEVRPGYAYNYLIPHGMATIATEHHKRMVEKHKVKLQQIELARQAELRKQASDLAKQSITIEANATEDGHLYGSVGAADIVAALKNNEIHLSADQIKLEGPLKELGLYTVKVRYSSEVEGELKVWVVPTVAAEQA
jgi:large subunit ribosomal protein L9